MPENLLRACIYSITKIVILKNTMINVRDKYLVIFVLKLVCILYYSIFGLS